MPRFREIVGPDGLQIPKFLFEENGIPEGTSVSIEVEATTIRIIPEYLNQTAIRKIALNYILDHVGDAVFAEQPQLENDKWKVPVRLTYQPFTSFEGRPVELGTLVFSKSGALIEPESTKPEKMIQKANET
jgi:hypothetical protein